jgi:hypothetical protein
MIDPARLLFSTQSTVLEKQLLASWNERPSDDARTRTLTMLGLASPLGVRRPLGMRV